MVRLGCVGRCSHPVARRGRQAGQSIASCSINGRNGLGQLLPGVLCACRTSSTLIARASGANLLRTAANCSERVRGDRAYRNHANREQPRSSRRADRAAVDRQLTFEQQHTALRLVERRILEKAINQLDHSRASQDNGIFRRCRHNIGVAIRLLDRGGCLLDFQVARDLLRAARTAPLPGDRHKRECQECCNNGAQPVYLSLRHVTREVASYAIWQGSRRRFCGGRSAWVIRNGAQGHPCSGRASRTCPPSEPTDQAHSHGFGAACDDCGCRLGCVFLPAGSPN